MPRINQTLDGFTLIRPVGLGALGQVWICREVESGQLKALRTLPPQEGLDRMESTLQWYRATAATMKGLIPVEHIGRSPEGDLFFTMPLADGVEGHSPEEPHWKPLTLSRQFQIQVLLKEWFTTAQMKRLLVPILEAVKRLHDAGMPYHEIDPDDILFVGGRPMLASFSFLSPEPPLPSLLQSASPEKGEFLSSGGTPTLWNVAAYLFAVLTGQPVEKLSRTKPLHPPKECQMGREDQREWQRLQGVLHQILWAPPARRMTHLREIIDAIDRPAAPPVRLPRKALLVTAGVAACVLLGGLLWVFARGSRNDTPPPVPVLQTTSEIARLIAERDDALQRLAVAEQELARLRAELEALRKPTESAAARPTPDPATRKSHAELEAALNETRRQLYGIPSNKKAAASVMPPINLGKTLQESLNKARLDAERKLQELESPPPKDEETLRNEARQRKIETSDPFRAHRPRLQGARLQPAEGL